MNVTIGEYLRTGKGEIGERCANIYCEAMVNILRTPESHTFFAVVESKARLMQAAQRNIKIVSTYIHSWAEVPETRPTALSDEEVMQLLSVLEGVYEI
jgi:hypothetical protein